MRALARRHEADEKRRSAVRRRTAATDAGRRQAIPSVAGLERALGNQAVQCMATARPVVNAPDDPFEREAERVADRAVGPDAPAGASIQRKAEVAGPPAGGERPVGRELGRRLERRRGAGTPIAGSTRRHFEALLGHDFRAVRVHTDPEAAGMARTLGARAFTHGVDLYFASGQYRPRSHAGRRLLAHELTHVVQQSDGRAGGSRTAAAFQAAPARIRRQVAEEPEDQPPGPDSLRRMIRARLNSLARNFERAALQVQMDLYRAAQETAELTEALFDIVMPFVVPHLARALHGLRRTRRLSQIPGAVWEEALVSEQRAEQIVESLYEAGKYAASQTAGGRRDAGGARRDVEMSEEERFVDSLADRFEDYVVGMQDQLENVQGTDALLVLLANYEEVRRGGAEHYRDLILRTLDRYRAQVGIVGRSGTEWPGTDFRYMPGFLDHPVHGRRLALVRYVIERTGDPRQGLPTRPEEAERIVFHRWVDDDMVRLVNVRFHRRFGHYPPLLPAARVQSVPAR